MYCEMKTTGFVFATVIRLLIFFIIVVSFLAFPSFTFALLFFILVFGLFFITVLIISASDRTRPPLESAENTRAPPRF
jgi:hypothetical protein